MSAARRVAATRIELVRARRELERVRRGTALVRRKREALVMELFRAARPALHLRERIGDAATDAARALLDALAVHGRAGLEEIAWPPRDVTIGLRPAVVWGIPVSQVTGRTTLRRTLDARGTAPHLTGPAAADAAARFEHLAELLVETAPREQLIRRLGDAVSRTTRQVRTLEQRVTPALERQVTAVRRQLDEREREDRIRLLHVARARHG